MKFLSMPEGDNFTKELEFREGKHWLKYLNVTPKLSIKSPQKTNQVVKSAE